MKLIQKNIHKLIKEVAAELDLPLAVVADITSSEFEFVKAEMAKGEHDNPDSFKSVLLKYLGTFQFARAKQAAIVLSKTTGKRTKNA